MQTSPQENTDGQLSVLACLHAPHDRSVLASEGHGPGIEIVVAASKAEVAKFLQEHHFDLFLLDADFPKEDLRAIIAAVRLRALELPIIFVTENPNSEIMFLSMESGSLDVLRKPVDERFIKRLLTSQRERLLSGRSLQVESFVANKAVTYELPSDVNLLPLAANKVAADIYATGAISAAQMYSLNLAIFECLTNALEHGNLEIGYNRKTQLIADGDYLAKLRQLCQEEPFRSRQIRLDYTISRNEIEVGISDDGKGFDFKEVESVPAIGQENEFHGRGLPLAMKMVDRLRYEPGENRIILQLKRLA